MMEALVGLLRNAENCNSKDVEVILLYLTDSFIRSICKNKKVCSLKWKKQSLRAYQTMLLRNISKQLKVYKRVSSMLQIQNTTSVQTMQHLLPGPLNISFSVKICNSKQNVKLVSQFLEEIKKARNSEEIITRQS